MPDREEVAARLAAAVLQATPERPGQTPDMIATCRYAVALYETILGMLPQQPPNRFAETGIIARRTGTGPRARDGSV